MADFDYVSSRGQQNFSPSLADENGHTNSSFAIDDEEMPHDRPSVTDDPEPYFDDDQHDDGEDPRHGCYDDDEEQRAPVGDGLIKEPMEQAAVAVGKVGTSFLHARRKRRWICGCVVMLAVLAAISAAASLASQRRKGRTVTSGHGAAPAPSSPVDDAPDVPMPEAEPDVPETLPDDAVFGLARTNCNAFCPVYAVNITADGSVTWEGMEHVEVTGVVKTQTTTEAVSELWKAFHRKGFFDMEENYGYFNRGFCKNYVLDAPSAITFVAFDGETKKMVFHDEGCQFDRKTDLQELELLIDSAANTQDLINAPPQSDPAPSPDEEYDLDGDGIPDDFELSMERTPCYGFCPSYQVHVNANGQVTWDGRGFVAVEGPKVYSVPQQTVRELWQAFVEDEEEFFLSLQQDYGVVSEQFCNLGYFTDGPTTYLTLTQRGRTKRVDHYTGCRFDDATNLVALQNLVDLKLRTDQWISTPSNSP